MTVVITESGMQFGKYTEEQVQDVFKRELKDEMRIWKISDFIVINEATARARNFII